MKKYDASMFRSWKRPVTRSAKRSERQQAKAECRCWSAQCAAEDAEAKADRLCEDYQLQLELEWAMATDSDEFDMLD